MYKINENIHREKYRLIIPATLDMHYPLLKYMFWSKKYWVEILDNTEDINDTGLAYSNNDMCYPYILLAGQAIRALKDGSFPAEKSLLLAPTAGDACRGACYIGLFKKSLKKAGFDACKVMTINVRHIEDEISLNYSLDMAIRGIYGLFYGDILMLLANQIRPYEINKGETDELWQKWINTVSEDLRSGKNLTRKKMYANFQRICDEFNKIPRAGNPKEIIGLVGEFYAKYCSLGNWDAVKFIEDHNCESHTNGLSWYVLYYIETHMPVHPGVEKAAFKFAQNYLSDIHNKMIEIIKANGFHSLPNLQTLKEDSLDYISQNLTIGDGWLMGAEVIGYSNSFCKKVLCVAPFGCMANVCAGRGLYPYLHRCFPDTAIVSVETDASGSKGNYYNRILMLIHGKNKAPTS